MFSLEKTETFLSFKHSASSKGTTKLQVGRMKKIKFQGKLSLVDGESIILVDKEVAQIKRVHNTDPSPDGCKQDHFCYSYEDLCTHEMSDHNMFGLCKGIFSNKPWSPAMPQGLLHDIPNEVLRKQPLLPRLLNECISPTHPGGRVEAFNQLNEILEAL